MARQPTIVPFTKAEIWTAKVSLEEWNQAGIATDVRIADDGALLVGIYSMRLDQSAALRVRKVVFPGVLFGKGRFIAHFFDMETDHPHDYVVTKNQRSLWPELLAIFWGDQTGLPDGTAAMNAARLL